MANALVCKTSIRGFNSLPVLHILQLNFRPYHSLAFSGKVRDSESRPEAFTETSRTLDPNLHGRNGDLPFSGIRDQLMRLRPHHKGGRGSPRKTRCKTEPYPTSFAAGFQLQLKESIRSSTSRSERILTYGRSIIPNPTEPGKRVRQPLPAGNVRLDSPGEPC